MTSMYPLPRQLRVSDPIAGDGVTTVFGPFSFKIFDTVDVVVYRKDAGDTQYGFDENVTVEKTTGAAYDNFTVTFPTPPAETSAFIVASQRLQQRDTDVTRGGTVDANELNKEISKIGSVLQELRRDVDRSYKAEFGQANPSVEVIPEGHFWKADAEGNMVDGGDGADIANAQQYAAAAGQSAASAREDADRAEAAAASIDYLTPATRADRKRRGDPIWRRVRG